MPNLPRPIADADVSAVFDDVYRKLGRARYTGQRYPTDPQVGDMWYNEVADSFQVWDGRAWKAH